MKRKKSNEATYLKNAESSLADGAPYTIPRKDCIDLDLYVSLSFAEQEKSVA